MMKPPTRRPRPRVSGTTDVSNTGARSVSTQSTGATGAASNTVRVSPTAAHDSLARGHIVEAQRMTSARTDEAFANAESHLASARQRALAAVPSEYRDRVGEHFDRASNTIAEQRKRFKG